MLPSPLTIHYDFVAVGLLIRLVQKSSSRFVAPAWPDRSSFRIASCGAYEYWPCPVWLTCRAYVPPCGLLALVTDQVPPLPVAKLHPGSAARSPDSKSWLYGNACAATGPIWNVPL